MSAFPNKSILFIAFFSIMSSYTKAQEEQFDGENKLAACQVILDISSRLKNSVKNREVASPLKDVELVWIYIDRETRKTKIPNVRRVYLVTEVLKDGMTVHYLMPSEMYKSKNPQKTVFFPTWSAQKANKFYRAECFDEAMKKSN